MIKGKKRKKEKNKSDQGICTLAFPWMSSLWSNCKKIPASCLFVLWENRLGWLIDPEDLCGVGETQPSEHSQLIKTKPRARFNSSAQTKSLYPPDMVFTATTFSEHFFFSNSYCGWVSKDIFPRSFVVNMMCDIDEFGGYPTSNYFTAEGAGRQYIACAETHLVNTGL